MRMLQDLEGLTLPDQKLPCPCKWEVGDQAVWVWDAVAVDRHHLTDTVAAAVEVEAFVTDHQRLDLPMAWEDVAVEMIATVVAVIVVDLVDLPHRAIGIEVAVVVDTTGAEVEATGNGIDLGVLIDGMEEAEEETVTVVGLDTNIHYGLPLMCISFCLVTTRSSCLA
jgi:hypothetical protein